MVRDLKNRLAAIRWDEFTHPCGFDSREIPSLLLELNSECMEASLRAANRLWNVVSHQGNVGSNSVPTLPFLIERLETADVIIQDEILDILYQFACAACPKNTEYWAKELHDKLKTNRAQIERLVDSPHKSIKEFAEVILQRIDATTCEHIDHNRTA